jgi:hypothetical protein
MMIENKIFIICKKQKIEPLKKVDLTTGTSFQVIIIYYNGIIYIYILYIDIMPFTERDTNIPAATTAQRQTSAAASGKENAPPKLAASVVTGNTAAAGTANLIRSLPRRSRSQRRGRGRSQRRGRGRSQRRGRGRN